MIYLDCSCTLLLWEGPPSGIQRVVYSLVDHSAERPEMVPVVCFLCPDTGKYIWASVPVEKVGEWQKLPVASTEKPGSPLREMIIHWGDKTLLPLLKALAPNQAWRWYSLKREWRKKRTMPSPRILFAAKNFPRIAMTDGDILFLADSTWGTPYLWDEIHSLKKRTPNFQVSGLLYDITPILHPDHYQPACQEGFAKFLMQFQSQVDGILAISRFALESFDKFQQGLENPRKYSPFDTVRLGDGAEISSSFGMYRGKSLGEILEVFGAQSSTPNAESALASTEWFFFPGAFHAKKNLDVVLFAMRQLILDHNLHVPLVVCGLAPLERAFLLRTASHDTLLAGNVIVLERVGDDLLEALYASAIAVLQPSWSEGHGLTVAEALQYGCPAIASSAESLPEVAGPLVDYFKPWRPDQLAELMKSFVADPEFRRQRQARIRAFQPTSWDQTLNQICTHLLESHAHPNDKPRIPMLS